MPKKPKTIRLSRHFDGNVRLVANMCSKCYFENDDVRITAVNRRFLKQVEKRRKFQKTEQNQNMDLQPLETINLQNLNITRGEKINEGLEEFTFKSLENPMKSFDDNTNDLKELRVVTKKVFINLEDWEAFFLLHTNSIEDFNDNNESSCLEDEEEKYKHEIKVEAFVKVCDNFETLHEESREFKETSIFGKVSDTYAGKKYSFGFSPVGSQGPLWSPPRSPHNLIEESLYHNPWALLVATIFLNKTSCMLARPYIMEFIKNHPNPEAVLVKKPADLEVYFSNLGLRKRARQIWKMSHDFLHKDWTNVKQLHGIGKYGEDAFRIFCLGDLDVEPNDRFLKIYKAWFKMKKREVCE